MITNIASKITALVAIGSMAAIVVLFAQAATSSAQSGEPPASPTGLRNTALHNAVMLTWDDPGDDSITGYRILRREPVTHELGYFFVVNENTGSAATTYTDDTVAAEVSYEYRVQAININGASPQSSATNTLATQPTPSKEAEVFTWPAAIAILSASFAVVVVAYLLFYKRPDKVTKIRVNVLWVATLIAILTLVFGQQLIGMLATTNGGSGNSTVEILLSTLVGVGIGGLVAIAGQLVQDTGANGAAGRPQDNPNPRSLEEPTPSGQPPEQAGT